jgi:hypothetical protein
VCFFARKKHTPPPSQEGIRATLRASFILIYYLITLAIHSSLEGNSPLLDRRPELNAVLTHPDIAALVTPLYAPRKEGISTFFYPLCGEAGERGGPAKRRPGESTVDGVISLQSLIAVFS